MTTSSRIVVLGMHRSGTSAVTGLLHRAGAWFGGDDDVIAANEENPRGFWERRDVRAVCDALLAGGGYDWWRVADLDLFAIDPAVVAEQREAFAAIVAELDEHRPWIVKEPRLCLLLPLLRPVLPDPVIVHVTRDPIEVAQSIEARSGFPVQAGIALWERYVLAERAATADLPSVQVRHHDLVSDPVSATGRLVAALTDLGVEGLSVPSDDAVHAFLSPDLHRQRPRSATDERLTRGQAEIAELIETDIGLIEPARPLSAAAHEALEVLADDQDRRAEVADLERRARVEKLRTDTVERRLVNTDRSYQELRQRAARPLALIAASRTKRLIGRTKIGDTVDSVARRVAGSSLDDADVGPTTVRTVGPTTARTPDRAKVAVLAWDVGHNPLGRAMVLAQILERRYDVEIWGAQFPRYGSDVWPPLSDTSIPIHVFDGRRFPSHLRAMDEVAKMIDADAVWVSKPRLPSFLLGILAKQAHGLPLVLDVDDRELSFFAEESGLGSAQLLSRRGQPGLAEPFERAWTRACDPAIGAADHVTVSNAALAELYGGTLVPHSRDERTFDPTLYDRDETRAALGFGPEHRLLLFGGTPRAHKGVIEVLRALDRLGDERYRLLVFGSAQLDEMRDQIGALGRWATALAPQPFSELARTVHAADLACVLQDPQHPVSAHQLPAKITDALAMEVPCLVTATPPVASLVEAGVVHVHDVDRPLHEDVAAVFDDPVGARARARRGRELFLAELSHGAMAERVGPIFDGLMADPPALAPRLEELVDTTRRVVAAPRVRDETDAPAVAATTAGSARAPFRPRRRLAPGGDFDVVVVWKQNDTGLYGRRQEMFLSHLARLDRVGGILHLDEPAAPERLAKLYLRGAGATADHSTLIATGTLARVAHRRDEGKIVHRTFLHGGAVTGRLGLRPRAEYPAFVRRQLQRTGVGRDRPLVLWAYPSNLDLPAVIDAVDPDLVVTDLVDDNRTWTRPGSALHGQIERNYAEVLARSEVVIANCDPVAEMMQPLTDGPIAVVPNGLELPDQRGRGPRPAILDGLVGPVLGYVGNLSSRIDIDLLEQIARARPQWNVVLVGSAHLDRTIMRLEYLPNVHFLGVLPYAEARQLVAHLDVGLIPHLDNDMTRAMNPLKAFVYAAAGVPVVSNPIANLADLGDLVTIASGRAEWVAAIEEALRRGRAEPDVEALRPHSWDARVEQVLDLIDAATGEAEPRS